MNDGFNFPSLCLEAQQIRLVKLQYQPGHASKICCDITVHELKPDLQFKALSYTWGKPSRNKISVNGDEFWIYDNLFEFLTLQSTNGDFCCSTYLWVDQVCIDQSNIRERNHQVNLMSKIYQLATSTIVWLGLPGKGNAMSGNVASKVTRAIQDLVYTSQSSTRIEIPCEDYVSPADLCSAAEVLCRHPLGIIRLLQSADYWKRLWIIQEIVLSKHPVLQCGPHTIEWAHFERCFDLWVPMDQKLTIASFGYHAIESSTSKKVAMRDSGVQQLGYLLQHRRKTMSGKKNGLTWKEALQLSKEAMCHRIHDKIFGLLGIVRTPLCFEADYDMELADVFNIVLRLEIEEEPDARSAMVQRMGPPILTHNREASLLAKSLKLDLTDAETNEIVENIYLRTGQWEYLESFLPQLFGGPRPSPWEHERAHTADVTDALGLPPVTYDVCTLYPPEPVDPQLAAAIGLQMQKLAEKYGLSSACLSTDSHQPKQPSSPSIADESHPPEDQQFQQI